MNQIYWTNVSLATPLGHTGHIKPCVAGVEPKAPSPVKTIVQVPAMTQRKAKEITAKPRSVALPSIRLQQRAE
jgi:hypothetical protein